MAIITHKFDGLTNNITYHARIFPINPKGFAQSQLDGQIASVIPSFPEAPTGYTLIEKITGSQTFVAPEDGYFQIEVQGKSGDGGNGNWDKDNNTGEYGLSGGGGGGGGGTAVSRVKLHKGDTISIINSGSTVTVSIDNSTDATYSNLVVTPASSGGNGYSSGYYGQGGTGGTGGIGSGGNWCNFNGNKGDDGGSKDKALTGTAYGGNGGNPSNELGFAGNIGGIGGSGRCGSQTAGKQGVSGFVNIYRGKTNIVA